MSPSTDTRSTPLTAVGSAPALRHLLIVGGTLTEWDALGEPAMASRVDQLGRHCSSIGVPWLTIRVYSSSGTDDALGRSHRRIDECGVTVDRFGDGRQRFVDAMQRLAPELALSETTVAEALYAPADAEPDLVVVLGPSTQLPPSLMWELAYAELVFLPVAWADFGLEHLSAAIADFAGRRRRFGGLDPD